jgi:hypothetical protein
VARAFMHAYVVASDKVREVTAEARESVEDMYAEAQADRRNTAPAAEASPIIAPGQTSARRREARSSGTDSAAARSRARGRTTRGSRTRGAGAIVTPAEAAAEAPAGASAAE